MRAYRLWCFWGLFFFVALLNLFPLVAVEIGAGQVKPATFILGDKSVNPCSKQNALFVARRFQVKQVFVKIVKRHIMSIAGAILAAAPFMAVRSGRQTKKEGLCTICLIGIIGTRSYFFPCRLYLVSFCCRPLSLHLYCGDTDGFRQVKL